MLAAVKNATKGNDSCLVLSKQTINDNNWADNSAKILPVVLAQLHFRRHYVNHEMVTR